MSANRITTTVELTRESFDPLFTSEFFNAPQQTEIPKPLPFPLPPGNTASEFANKLDKFINSKEGDSYKNGVKTILDNIHNTIGSWNLDNDKKKRWHQELVKFYQKYFINYSATNTHYNKTLHSLFTEGITNFNNLLQNIQDEKLPIGLRQRILSYLLDSGELDRCGPGTAGFIADATKALNTSPAERLSLARQEITTQVAKEVYNTLGSNTDPEHAGMEVHYVKSFTFQYAQLLGLKQDSYDVYFDNLNPKKSEKLFEGIIKKLPKALILDNMIPHLIAPFDLDAIVHDLKNYLSELQKDTDNKDSIPLLLTSYYESKINALKDELDQYGMDEDWVTGTLIDIDFAEDSITITLDPDAIKTLEITLINRLFAREILNPNHRIAIEFAFGRTDVLHLIAGKNNVDLAYVKVSNNGEKYTPFFNYYNALTPEKKKTVNETLGRQYTLANDQQKLGITKLMDHELIFSSFLENKIVDPTAILRIEFLIRNGATPTPEIQKLLLNIAENDSALYLKWLQEKIILPTWKNKKGLTPIVFAATHGKTELVAFLIDHCKSTDNNGVSLLALAVYGRHIETIEFLIAKGAKTTQDIQESLFFMVKNDGALFLKWLQNNIIPPTKINNFMPDLIHVASEKGYLDVVKHLVNQNKSMLLNTYRDEMPIHIAARCGNVELLKYFINDCKISPDKRCRGWGPLDFAIQAKNVASITYLSEMGADMNRTGNHRSRFDDIMQSRNKNMIYLLLSSGMSVPDYYASSNHLSEYDQTPIVPDELLKAFNNIPAPDPGRTDLESSRNLYLRDVRARTLEAYKESTDATLGKRADLTQELKDFATLEDWIKKLKSLVNLPAQKTPALIKNIDSLSLICYNAYLVCLEKKSPKEAMTYLQKNCHAIIEASNAFLIDIPSKFPFFKTKNLKNCLDDLLTGIEKKISENQNTRNHKP